MWIGEPENWIRLCTSDWIRISLTPPRLKYVVKFLVFARNGRLRYRQGPVGGWPYITWPQGAFACPADGKYSIVVKIKRAWLILET